MIEEFIRTGVTVLITQGSGWVVAVLLGVWAYVLDTRVNKLSLDNDKSVREMNRAVQEQYEKRLVEFKELLDVMTSSTNTVTAMHGSLNATTAATTQLSQAFSKLLTEFNSYQGRWDDRGGIMARQIEDIRQKLETLHREVSVK